MHNQSKKMLKLWQSNKREAQHRRYMLQTGEIYNKKEYIVQNDVDSDEGYTVTLGR